MKYWAPFNGQSEDVNSVDGYIDGDDALGIEGSVPTGRGFEQILRELVNLTVKGGCTPSEVINGIQVAQAVQSHKMNFGFDTGSADALAVTLDPLPVGLINGLFVNVKKGAAANATTAPTLNVNDSGNKTIVWSDGSALFPSAMGANGFYSFLYDAVRGQWILISMNVNAVTYLSQVTGTNTVIYSTAGSSGYFIVPAGVFMLREVEVVGAGGGGGGGGVATGAGGGGNGGSVVRGPMAVVPGQQLSYYIGIGGYGGTAAYDGGGGGDTYFGSWIAAGGNGGHSDSNPGGATRPSSGGEEIYPGQQGVGGRTFASGAPSNTTYWGGTGGGSVAGGQGGDGAVDGGTPGNPGIYPGGAGGGGTGGTYTVGGYGGGGRVLIRY